jgi:hypothetical protein
MMELILSDITVMGLGYCVIGLERTAQGVFRSVRPMPHRSYAWPTTFPYNRGNKVRFMPAATLASPPHLEDQNTHGLAPAGEGVSELDLVVMLQGAEVSANLEGLFGCELRTDTQGGNAWVDPGPATRSICGCDFRNIRFRVFGERGELNLRAKLVLPSGETLSSLPVVDRDWRRFFNDLVQGRSESRTTSDPETFLNGSIRREIMRAPYGFARIGLARAKPKEGKCWLMLDSLFPQPNPAWLGSV